MPGKKPTPADLKRFREILDGVRRVLRGDIDHLEADALGNPSEKTASDISGDGFDSFAQEFNLELLARDGETLGRVEKALERIEVGTFGRCLECEAWIAKARLLAVPYAENCIQCQRALEMGA